MKFKLKKKLWLKYTRNIVISMIKGAFKWLWMLRTESCLPPPFPPPTHKREQDNSLSLIYKRERKEKNESGRLYSCTSQKPEIENPDFTSRLKPISVLSTIYEYNRHNDGIYKNWILFWYTIYYLDFNAQY